MARDAEPGYGIAQTVPAESQGTLAGYFDALKSGDLDLLGQVIGGDLRVRRASLLGNQEYSDTLIQTFGNAQFVIVEYLIPSEDLHIAVVDCWFTGAERARYRLTLQRVSSNEELKITNARVEP